MFDKFNTILSFAADPPEGGGGTKGKIGGSGVISDLNADPPVPVDPPEGGGGTDADETSGSSTATD